MSYFNIDAVLEQIDIDIIFYDERLLPIYKEGERDGYPIAEYLKGVRDTLRLVYGAVDNKAQGEVSRRVNLIELLIGKFNNCKAYVSE